MKRVLGLILPLTAFALYLHTMGPTIVPYRDAGEMATTVSQLGVLHPPGYPLYTQIGHLFTELPFANPAYRLNLLSALSLAVVWALLFWLICELWGLMAATLTVGLAAVSFMFWIHALIAEMYTLNLVFVVGLLILFHLRKFYAAAFLFGLGLGARMDLMLCAPAFGVLFWLKTQPEERLETFWKGTLCFFAGCSIFFYLWIRANGGPLLNWGDPSTLDRFWASLVRRSYGGTLDLLSLNYHAGENFLPEFNLYARHLGRDFTLLSFPLVLIGVVDLWTRQRTWFWTLILGWLCTGPLFIFLGNLPTNPHAVAIMEASYLMPDIFFVLVLASGLGFIYNVIPAKAGIQWLWAPASAGVTILMAILIGAQGIRFYPVVSKRNNWVGADFIRNVMYSVPEPSMIVSRSDVPTFLLFYGHWVYPGLKWRVPVAQGLAGSPWYQVMMNAQIRKLDLQPMQTLADWNAQLKANPGWTLYGTMDTEWTPDLYPHMIPQGPVMRFQSRGEISVTASDVFLSDLGVYRGRYRYDAYKEFFTPELIEEYARAWMEWGRLLNRKKQVDAEIDAYRHALALKPDMPYAAFQMGYAYFSKGDLDRADWYYHWAVDNFRIMHRQANEWKTLPTQRLGVLRDEAQALSHWGVIQERKGNSELAVALYQKALEVDPESADARYNLAVMYWRAGRWKDVVEHLQRLSAAHPDDPRWRAYLPKAIEKLEQTK